MEDSNPLIYKVLAEIAYNDENEFVTTYSRLMNHTGSPKGPIRDLINTFKLVGWVRLAKAVSDEGRMAGSGFMLTDKGRKAYEEMFYAKNQARKGTLPSDPLD
jgi:hypothetical protein